MLFLTQLVICTGLLFRLAARALMAGVRGMSSVAARSAAVGVSGKLVAGRVKPLGMGPARWMACGLNRLVLNARSVSNGGRIVLFGVLNGSLLGSVKVWVLWCWLAFMKVASSFTLSVRFV